MIELIHDRHVGGFDHGRCFEEACMFWFDHDQRLAQPDADVGVAQVDVKPVPALEGRQILNLGLEQQLALRLRDR
ncbi:MAG: hypothetical protein K9N23_13810 [Akkermansiaceae bacterium]|nr:hypothetical protein [Akkermansiaceae bacterium]